MVQLFIWVGPSNTDIEKHQFGDIIDVLEDGQHPGKLVVKDAWNSDCIMPNVVVLDVPDAFTALKNAAFLALGMPAFASKINQLNSIVSINTQNLPALIRNRLNTRKRASVTLIQLASAIFRAARANDEWINTRLLPEQLRGS